MFEHEGFVLTNQDPQRTQASDMWRQTVEIKNAVIETNVKLINPAGKSGRLSSKKAVSAWKKELIVGACNTLRSVININE